MQSIVDENCLNNREEQWNKEEEKEDDGKKQQNVKEILYLLKLFSSSHIILSLSRLHLEYILLIFSCSDISSDTKN